MNNVSIKERSLGQRILWGLVIASIWLPIIGIVLVFSNADSWRGLSGAMALMAIFQWLFDIGVGALMLLVVYALWARPWRFAGRARNTFLFHVLVVAVVIVLSVGFFF